MVHYIDKDALVAEIKKREKIHFNDYHINKNGGPADYGACNALHQLLSFINTLEVKEMDLEKEIQTLWNLNQESTDSLFIPMNYNGLRGIAKHFFELGIFSQLTWQDIRFISELGEDFMNCEESDNLSEEEYYTAILYKLKKKGRDYETDEQRIRNLTQKGE